MATIGIPARLLEDHDDCLAAACDHVREALQDVDGWDLNPRWEGDERTEILVDVPDDVLASDRDDAEHVGSVAYVACVYGESGDEPGDCEVKIMRGDLRWWLTDGDDTERCEAGSEIGYATREEACAAAIEIAEEQHEAEDGEDTEAMRARLRAEAEGRACSDGPWAVAWRDGSEPGLDVGRRYEDRDDAEHEIACWYADVRAHTPTALTHLMRHPVLAEVIDGSAQEVAADR